MCFEVPRSRRAFPQAPATGAAFPCYSTPVTVAERVIDVISKSREIPAESIQVESTFEELGLDSLDAFEVLYALEQEFDVVIPDEAARGLRTVGDIVERLGQLAAGGAAEAS